MSQIQELRDALAKIARIASDVSKGKGTGGGGNGGEAAPAGDVPGCSIKALPKRVLIQAAKHAAEDNPANDPQMAPIAGDVGFAVLEPMQVAVLTQQYRG